MYRSNLIYSTLLFDIIESFSLDVVEKRSVSAISIYFTDSGSLRAYLTY